MPPQDQSVSRQAPNNVYTLMLIISAVFILAAIAMVYHETSTFYGDDAGVSTAE